MNELTISVSQLNTYVKNIFDAEELLIGVKVVGEITNLKISGRSVYFDLKDENASIPCVVFDMALMDGFDFGDKVVVKGKLNFYIKGGKLSFVVSKIEKYGVGELYKQFLELKDKLEAEGLFESCHKKELPCFAKRVGVVTSRTGAVIRDIIRVKKQKNHWSDVVLYPVKVQGVGAKEEIISGIKILDDYGVDIIIVARGGGSFEDYQPFNTEDVARAVFEAKTPIISAIGHESDWSIIDFVADRRASTPSVASEMAFFDESLYLSRLIQPLSNFLLSVEDKLKSKHSMISSRTNELYLTLKNQLKQKFNLTALKFANIDVIMQNFMREKEYKIKFIGADLSKHNPIEILSRGFGKLSKNGAVVTSIKDVKQCDEMEVELKDGSLKTQIIEIREKNNESR